MKKLLLLIIGTILFISVSAQSQFFQIASLRACTYDNEVIIDCNDEIDQSLFEFSDGFRYVTRNFGDGIETFKVYNAFRITDTDIFSIECYDMVTKKHYQMLQDYDRRSIYIERKEFSDVSLCFYWIRSWSE